MSTTSRLISGSIASWAKIFVTMFTQVLLVPVYLSYWDVKMYGIWIAIQALVNIFSTFDRGYLDYLGYEFLKVGVEDKKRVGLLVWSGFVVVVFIGLLQLFLISVISFSSSITYLLGETAISAPHSLSFQAGWVLILQSGAWFIGSNINGLFFRSLSAFGYFPRMGWWNVTMALVTSFIPVIAVVFGADLLWAGIWTVLGTLIVALPQYIDIFILLKKEEVPYICSIKEGWKNYRISLVLSCRYFLENFRQQGIRLLLAPMSGAVILAEFSTMRTIANVALQGLSTITSPLMPELMRFLHQRNQVKMELSFGTIWGVLLVCLVPGVVILQFAAPLFFPIWTKGQILFNPVLFAILSIGVLVYAYAQPAMSIVAGNNLLKTQVIISVVSCLIVLGGIFLLYPFWGVTGAGIALLIAEGAAAVGFKISASKWLSKNGLCWPVKASKIVLISICSAVTAMFCIALFPLLKWLFLAVSLVLSLLFAREYFKIIPLDELSIAKPLFLHFPYLKKHLI